ncbi:hypothetical protein F4802DRAFT_441317 [Xylaria palmicola]|nr:hypothetical protein F4802DRAFT_441317 [Xylaria palmicola]
MLYSKVLATVVLAATPILASTPQGYGYGDVTDTIVDTTTTSFSLDVGTPPATTLVTTVDSVTVTRPITVTHTVTVWQPECSSETTGEDTTGTTLTSKNTVFVSASRSPSRSPRPSSPSSPSSTSTADATGIPGEGSTTDTLSAPTPSTTGFVVGNTTSSCDSLTTATDVDGVTGSLSSDLVGGAPTLSLTRGVETSSLLLGGGETATRTGATRTSTLTATPSVFQASGARDVVDSRMFLGVVGLACLASHLVV